MIEICFSLNKNNEVYLWICSSNVTEINHWIRVLNWFFLFLFILKFLFKQTVWVTTAKLYLHLKFKPEYSSVYLCLYAIIINLFIIALCTVTSSMSWTGPWDQPGLREVWLHNADCTACVCMWLYTVVCTVSVPPKSFLPFIFTWFLIKTGFFLNSFSHTFFNFVVLSNNQ